MDYLTAWREGHEAGMQLVLKIINELTGQEFEKSSEVVLYIKQLENDNELYYEHPAPIEVKEDLPKQEVETETQQNKFINRLANRIAMRNTLWS